MSTLPYEVIIKRKVSKNLNKTPFKIQKKFNALVRELMEKGPVLPNWPNYQKLDKTKFHCHLSYHWVACWEYKQKTLIIEVYYVGSREKAPY